MDEEKKGFRVVDRRNEPKEEKKGEGFIVKDPKKEEKPTALDQLDFSTFVFSLATSAIIHMGLAPDPQTKKTVKNLEVAKQNIDILGILEEKTKGNLSNEEEQLLTNLLAETRVRFVQASKK